MSERGERVDVGLDQDLRSRRFGRLNAVVRGTPPGSLRALCRVYWLYRRRYAGQFDERGSFPWT
jgi:hypothetical protein